MIALRTCVYLVIFEKLNEESNEELKMKDKKI